MCTDYITYACYMSHSFHLRFKHHDVTEVVNSLGDYNINPLNPELNPICYLLALLGAHHFLHVSRIRVKLLTFRLLMSYIYDISRLKVNDLTLILLTWRKW